MLIKKKKKEEEEKEKVKVRKTRLINVLYVIKYNNKLIFQSNR